MRILKEILRWALAVFFIAAGCLHFRNPHFYERMMPPYLPWPYALVLISGVCEIILGLALLVPRLTRFAAFGLIALLLAVFPANLQMALHPELFPEFTRTALLIRLPLQLVLILWASWYTRKTTDARG